jgi:hypothetical protein
MWPGHQDQVVFLDYAFQGWKVALCLSGVAGVDTLWCQLVFESGIWAHMMFSWWTVGT